VLVCPDCQADPGLAAELDHCRTCGSVRLVRRLGEVECRACGFVAPPGTGGGEPAVARAGDAAPGLAEEVALALERVLGRGSGAPPASAPVR
jgi:hypothetical protein